MKPRTPAGDPACWGKPAVTRQQRTRNSTVLRGPSHQLLPEATPCPQPMQTNMELLHGQQQRGAGTKQAAMRQESSDRAGNEQCTLRERQSAECSCISVLICWDLPGHFELQSPCQRDVYSCSIQKKELCKVALILFSKHSVWKSSW